MEYKVNNAKFKLGFGKKKIYVYNNREREEVDVIYLDNKISREMDFRMECNVWYAENWEVVED